MTHRKAADVAWTPAGPEHFTGEVRFGPLHTPHEPADLNVLAVGFAAGAPDLNVLAVGFAAGARSDWHSHPAGQVLYVVSGTALVHAEGESTVVARPGDA